MTDLGEFGTSREAASLTFSYFGETLRTNPDLTDVMVIDLFNLMDSGDTPVGQRLQTVVATLVHPDDVDRFREAAKANRQHMEDLGLLAMQLAAAITDRPTLLPSDSSDGQSSTDTSSEDDSSSRALRLLDGRPDLQVAVIRAQASA